MFREIVRTELLKNIYSFKFVLALPVCLVLVLLSVYLGLEIYRSQLKEYQHHVQSSKEELARQADQIGITPVVNYKLIKPPSVLSIMVFGLTGDAGNIGEIHSHPGIPEVKPSKYVENPIFAMFGILDTHFVVIYILSLLAILFTYDAVCGEKETGTLRLVLSNSVPKHLILIGKVVGNSITLFVPLLLTALVVLVMIVLSPEISLNSEEISKAVLIIYVFLVYLLGFFFLGILISTTTQQTRVALLLLLLLWISSISVIPPMSFTAVERSIPIPSWFESQTRINANLRNMDKAVMDDIMKMVHTSAKPVDMEKFSDEVNAIRKSARERALRENAKIQEDFEQREKRQIEVAMDISRISPAAALSNAATALAGNDFYSHYLFKKSLRAYKERFLAFLEKQGVLARQVADPEELLGRRLDLTTLPAYRFTGESLSETIQRIFPDLILLHGFPILLFTISYLVFIKYDVR